ncbi:hypothetical protein MMA231_02418 [Asticcacaulis sp. MM231]|uniref:hypothetical protein n=1 Tax=Asticcacaulis sp. MM231 TaxID=3157666 RepID=UPI0032D57765
MSLAQTELKDPAPELTAPDSPILRPDGWLSDFEWRDGRILIRKTGIRIRLDPHVLHEIFNWALYLALLHIVAFATHLTGRPRPRLWFAPDRPRPWYLVRGAAMWSGIDLAKRAQDADAAIYFDDSTTGDAPPSLVAKRFNHGCTDISKSHVARVFEEIFGYPLTVDPMLIASEIVEKPEKNGVHGGRIVMAPCPPRCGFVYQRLIDTRDPDGCCHYLRTPCAGGEAVLVWVKIKTPEGRFSIHNRRAALAEVADIYTPQEQTLIRQFTARMGLDWGGLDILRDRGDGRITSSMSTRPTSAR